MLCLLQVLLESVESCAGLLKSACIEEGGDLLVLSVNSLHLWDVFRHFLSIVAFSAFLLVSSANLLNYEAAEAFSLLCYEMLRKSS